MRTDSRIGGGASARTYRHPLLSSISVFLQCLTAVVDPMAKRRVRCTPQAASTTAVVMALDRGCSLQSRFDDARSCMRRDFRGRRRTGSTYNGLLKALERQQAATSPIVKTELRRRMRRCARSIEPTSPWVLLAVDGSKEDLPRTRDHERCSASPTTACFRRRESPRSWKYTPACSGTGASIAATPRRNIISWT